jgi:hypothetical protein
METKKKIKVQPFRLSLVGALKALTTSLSLLEKETITRIQKQ